MNIAQVHLYHWQPNRRDRIPNRYAGVGVSPGVNNNTVFAFNRILNAVYQCPFMVGLKDLHPGPKSFCLTMQTIINRI